MLAQSRRIFFGWYSSMAKSLLQDKNYPGEGEEGDNLLICSSSQGHPKFSPDEPSALMSMEQELSMGLQPVHMCSLGTITIIVIVIIIIIRFLIIIWTKSTE